jgi:hypothetical protein
MIIQDQHGTVLLEESTPSVITDRHGHTWRLSDAGDGLELELVLYGEHAELAVVPVSAHACKIRVRLLGRNGN